MRRLALAALLVLPVLAVGEASANCAGPVIEVQPASGAAGDRMTVTGRFWGTNCYDTGPPPAGEGPLGPPDTGIEITFVDAAGSPTVLGTVDASAEYTIRLATAVPAGAVDGAARIEAVSSTGFDVRPAVFTVGTGVVPATPSFTG
jgi:hypothetical protein